MWNSDTTNKLSQWLLTKSISEEIAYELHGLNHCISMYCPVTLSKDKTSWLSRKRNTVLRFQLSTLDVFNKNGGDEMMFYQKYGLNPTKFTITPGSIPLFDDQGLMCGVITITGKTPQEDHEIALEAKLFFETLK
ncbi:MAG: heme-binding protein [Erysipelothrix sp.]